MPTQAELDFTYLDIARAIARLSKSKRNKVGAVLVRDGSVISEGYNGTPAGWSNTCEDADGATLPEVLHAEANAIAKIARSTQSSQGATLYTTLGPCLECAKLIHQAGITRVVYAEEYRDGAGIALLDALQVPCGIPTEIPLVHETTKRLIDTVHHKMIERFTAHGPHAASAGSTYKIDIVPPAFAFVGNPRRMTFEIEANSEMHALVIAGIRIGRAFHESEREAVEAAINASNVEIL